MSCQLEAISPHHGVSPDMGSGAGPRIIQEKDNLDMYRKLQEGRFPKPGAFREMREFPVEVLLLVSSELRITTPQNARERSLSGALAWCRKKICRNLQACAFVSSLCSQLLY